MESWHPDAEGSRTDPGSSLSLQAFISESGIITEPVSPGQMGEGNLVKDKCPKGAGPQDPVCSQPPELVAVGCSHTEPL